MEHIFPQGKDTILRAFTDSVEEAVVPPLEVSHIVHYDEQFPKRGRSQKYRLTLLDHFTAQPIADELHDKKDPDTIKKFLGRHLDPNTVTFVVTDLYPSYSGVLEDFFGENLIHQFCLLHLNKRIVNDSCNCSLQVCKIFDLQFPQKNNLSTGINKIPAIKHLL